jgi:hypothetical protein
VSLLSDILTPSDEILASSPSFAGRIFREPFDFKNLGFSVSNDSYIHFCRFFLGLPPALTIGAAKPNPDFDYSVQKCLANHGVAVDPFLDAAADHASSGCPATTRARFQKHSNVMRVIISAAREAGLVTRCEPDTHSLLLEEFSKADCRRVFPKVLSNAYKSGWEKLSQAVDFISSANCALTPEEKQSYIQTKIDLLPILAKGEATGLRIDACLENPETGETQWVDGTCIHTSAASYRVKELAFIAKKKLSADLAELHKLPDVFQSEPSPNLLQRESEKIEKYCRLVMVAKKQHQEGKRASIPSFVPFVFSDSGQLSPRATELQEWIVDQYKRACLKNGPRADGRTTTELVRIFRQRFRLKVQLAIAAGLGNMIQAAGQAWGGLGPV